MTFLPQIVWAGVALVVIGLVGCSTPRQTPALLTNERLVIRTDGAPTAIGPYSQALLVGDTLYVSGQIPLDPRTGQLVTGGIREQTDRVMRNLEAILTAAGLGFEDVVQAQVFLTDLHDFAAMNEIYATHFTVPPARITIQAGRLPRDAKVEIAVIASRRESLSTRP